MRPIDFPRWRKRLEFRIGLEFLCVLQINLNLIAFQRGFFLLKFDEWKKCLLKIRLILNLSMLVITNLTRNFEVRTLKSGDFMKICLVNALKMG